MIIAGLLTTVLSKAQPELPVVLWHGMGGSSQGKGMANLTRTLEDILPSNTFVHSIRIGDSEETDRSKSFFDSLDRQVDEVCQQLKAIPELNSSEAINALGFSQGGLFLRAYVQRCVDGPKIHRLITFGSPHAGVSDAPGCQQENNRKHPASASRNCQMMRSIINAGVYLSWVQHSVVQAQYFKKWSDYPTYIQKSAFLAEINLERESSHGDEYKSQLSSLDKLVLVRFEQDEMVVPRDTAWFSFFDAQGVLQPIEKQPYYEKLGLHKTSIEFVSLPGDHMRIAHAELVSLVKWYFLGVRDVDLPTIVESGRVNNAFVEKQEIW